MLEETLVKEEIMDHLPEDKDSLLGSGMDYGSMTSDGRLENSSSDGGTQEHQLLSAKYEQQSLAPSQTHHLPEAVVEALAGPSGMQGVSHRLIVCVCVCVSEREREREREN
ncbi:hypothetical protein E2C01_083422 [Portunus trituberculatus]|uniref:Uncharacterized protein n=1 Tax=Portunus trituberculatus TaxID=210409 RepID=A0A5B7J3G0_PORTR|nr:hypothetical protein [Portunus trituberculatus]